MDEKVVPGKSPGGYKSLIAKEYSMLRALTDNGADDPEVRAYLARLEKILDAPDEES
jgi:hypothetical protein